MLETLLRFWCRQFHHKMFRPFNGYYVCGDCLRAYPVAWETKSHRLEPQATLAVTEPATDPVLWTLPDRSATETVR